MFCFSTGPQDAKKIFLFLFKITVMRKGKLTTPNLTVHVISHKWQKKKKDYIFIETVQFQSWKRIGEEGIWDS